MADVTITIKDMPNGTVEVKCEPNFESMLRILDSGHELSSAEGYAVGALNAIRWASKQEGRIKVEVPRWNNTPTT